jgi:RsiW-degrading membrane proteinase PrsW (M82 family)
MSAEGLITCTVCGRSSTEGRIYGRRSYCAEHLAEFVTEVPAVWQASILAFGGLILLIAGIGLASVVLPQNQTLPTSAALFITVLPPVIWLTVLYRTARLNKATVSPLLPTVMLLGALIAAAAVRPLLFQLLQLPAWLSTTTQNNRLLGNVLIYGFIDAFVLYGVVRYTVWRTPAFSHRVDGVMFAVAAGWGYAAMFALLYVLDQGELTLVNGGLRVLSLLCSYLAPAYIIGFFLGRNRFEDMPFYYLASGVAMAAGINGLMLFAGVALNSVGLSITNDAYSPWPGIVLCFAILIATYVTILGLLRRHNSLTKARLERHE